MPNNLRAGAAEKKITPPVGVDLCGFAFRPSESTGINDDLFCRALVFSSEETSLVLVTTDLIGLDLSLCDRITCAVEERTVISPGQVMLTSTHTHAGPVTRYLRGLGESDTEYLDILCTKIVDTIVKAYESMEPVRIGWGRAGVQIGINRRERHGGQIRIGSNPDGLILPYADVLRVDRSDGSPLAIWCDHAAHPVVFGGRNTLISADWPGATARAISQGFSGETVAMVSQGCGGDINPINFGGSGGSDGSSEDVERLGRTVGEAVLETAEKIVTLKTDRLSSAVSVLELPLIPPTSLEEAENALSDRKIERDKIYVQTNDRLKRLLMDELVEWGESYKDVAENPTKEKLHAPFTLQTFRIGNGAIVAMSGEMFAAYAQEIEQHSPFKRTAVLGYTNGCLGYIPTQNAFQEGGYEVDAAYRYYGTLSVETDTWGTVTRCAAEQLNRLS